MLQGIPVSPGIAIGKVLIKKEQKIELIKKNNINVTEELEKLTNSIDIAREQINQLYTLTLNTIGEKEAEIFDAHNMILDDPEFLGQIREKVASENINVEWAIKEVLDNFVMIFENMDNEYMRERAADLKDVSNRVIRIILGVELNDFSKLEEEVIIIANDLTPSDTAQMDKEKVIGFIIEIGGRTSHTAIMARTLGIPAIVGVGNIIEFVENGDTIMFDGDNGEIIINPEEEEIEKYRVQIKQNEKIKTKLNQLKGCESVSEDGIKVELAANIGTPDDIESVIEYDGEGVGLFRSEFLYMNRDKLPSEEEQFNAYKKVAKRMKSKNVIVRTLDIGGDKELEYLSLEKETNPFLGYRAIRLCLGEKEIFKTQLRALLRASAYGNIKIMFPMISSIEELREAKGLLEEIKSELRDSKVQFNENIEVGIMIEIPAAALISDLLAKEVDFFSVGTNDLIQYMTAVDRMNQKISHLYNQYHPAVLRLINMVIDSGHKEGIWVGMCGEVAADPKMIPILLGMGLDEFSMSPISILKARWIINHTSQKAMKEIIKEVLMMSTGKEVEEFIDENIKIEY
jgi:phosphotransferase system enzyme I (PtsI)